MAALGTVLAGLLLGAPAALATTTATWTGLEPTTSSPVGNWAVQANWNGPVPGNGEILDFPALAGCNSSVSACDTSDATSSSTEANLSIADNQAYSLLASPGVTLKLQPPVGTDGLDAAPSASDPASGSPYIALPLVLGNSQQWTIAGGAQLSIGSVTGAPNQLAVNVSGGAQLDFAVSLATGPVTITGTGGGTPAQKGLVGISGSANNASGDGPIDVQSAALLLGNYAGHDVDTGSLVLQGGALTIGGSGPNGPGRSVVSGTVSLDPVSATVFELEGTGTTPGSDYAELVASGNVMLGGQLTLSDEGAPAAACATPALGSSDTLISTTGGTITGEFANLPDGSITSITANCGGATLRYPIQIHYTPTAVTGTFLPPTATSTSLGASPQSSIVANSVTLTATVTPSGAGAGAPTGAVSFFDGTTPIACSAGGPLTGGSPDVATCTTPELPLGANSITAVYAGDGAWAGSTAPAIPVAVNPAPTGGTAVKSTHHVAVAGSGVPRLGFPTVKAETVSEGVSCARGGASCAVRVRIVTIEKVRHGRKLTRHTIVLGGVKLAVTAGHRRVARIRLNRTGRRLLRREHVRRAELILQRRVHGHVRTVGMRKVTLRLPRHRTARR